MINKLMLSLFLLVGIQSFAFALANPAATYCLKQGNRYLIVKNVGICIFPDNSYCEEWAYFKGECKPSQQHPAVGNNPHPTLSHKWERE
jgi:hypothetical protein